MLRQVGLIICTSTNLNESVHEWRFIVVPAEIRQYSSEYRDGLGLQLRFCESSLTCCYW